MAQQPQSKDTSPRSPFAGCTIIMVGIAAMGFLVIFVIWNLFKLDDEISKFTTDTAVETPTPDLLANTAAFNAYKAKLQVFKDTVGKKEDAELRLSATEINLAIASDPERFKDLQKTFSVASIQDGKLHIQISFPLRGKPMSGEFRYLNGTMIAIPTLAGDEIVLTVETITSPGTDVKNVPEGFIGQMSPYRIAQRYMEDEDLGPWMKKLTHVSIDGDHLVLSGYTHSEAKAQAAPKNLSPFIKRAAALFAVFLVFFMIVIIALVTASRRRKAAMSENAEDI